MYPKGPEHRQHQIARRGALKPGAASLGALATGAVAGRVPGPDAGASPGARLIAQGAPERPFAASPMERIRVGFVCVGLPGGSHARNFLALVFHVARLGLLVKCLREGSPTDTSVCDGAALPAVCPLSEWSVANRRPDLLQPGGVDRR